MITRDKITEISSKYKDVNLLELLDFYSDEDLLFCADLTREVSGDMLSSDRISKRIGAGAALLAYGVAIGYMIANNEILEGDDSG